MPEEPRLATYGELVDQLVHLRLLLQAMRRSRRITMKEAGDEIGCSASTVHRIEKGEDCSLQVAVDVLRWLDKATTS